jgi:hypothetical protein
MLEDNQCVGMKKAHVTKNQTLGNVEKLFIMFQRVKKSRNTISQAAGNKTDIFEFCYHDFFIC